MKGARQLALKIVVALSEQNISQAFLCQK